MNGTNRTSDTITNRYFRIIFSHSHHESKNRTSNTPPSDNPCLQATNGWLSNRYQGVVLILRIHSERENAGPASNDDILRQHLSYDAFACRPSVHGKKDSHSRKSHDGFTVCDRTGREQVKNWLHARRPTIRCCYCHPASSASCRILLRFGSGEKRLRSSGFLSLSSSSKSGKERPVPSNTREKIARRARTSEKI